MSRVTPRPVRARGPDRGLWWSESLSEGAQGRRPPFHFLVQRPGGRPAFARVVVAT